jgi:energy-coupling factor transport system substrate-specific component
VKKVKGKNFKSTGLKPNLQIKDLIVVGVLAAVFAVVYFVFGMTLGPIPITFMFLTTVAAIPGGIIVMLLLAKVPKTGVIAINGILFSLVLLMTGHWWIMIVLTILGAVIADLFYSLGDKKSFVRMATSYTIYMLLFAIGAYSPMILFPEAYFESMGGSSGPYATYFPQVLALLRGPAMFLIPGGTVIGSVIGAYLGRKLLKKHFIAAGIV